jgi:hypothetical protein
MVGRPDNQEEEQEVTFTPKQVGAAAPSHINFMRADDWGCNPIHKMYPEQLSDPEAYIHHTAGSRMSSNPILAMIRLEAAAHNMGYATVAYDAVLHMDVDTKKITIMGGREGFRSAATKDRNEEGEALCLMGYFHPGHALSEQPHPREIEGAAWGIVWMIAHGWIADEHTILGHRDNPAHPGATACPGDFLYQWLPDIRTKVAKIMKDLNTPPPPPANPDINHETGEYFMQGTTPYRVIDTRESGGGPGTMHAVHVKVDGDVKVVNVSIAVVSEVGGFLSDRVGTSFLNYSRGATNMVLDMPVQPDGKIYFGSSLPCHVIVDVRGTGK